ncbi:MAG TPA: transcriptional regulator [Gammaproteobacteria bacterium]|nr:transcriptional regulator [Gammaproteobacteria bacterium]
MAKKLAVLGHPTRLAIIRLLVRAGPAGLAAGHLGRQLNTAPNALTFHLQRLAHTGLITPRRQGQFIIYSAVFPDLLRLAETLVGACCANSPDKCGPQCPSENDTVGSPYPKIVPQKEL